VEQAKHVPGHRRQVRPAGQLAAHVVAVGAHRLEGVHHRSLSEQPRVHLAQQAWRVIGRAAQHHPVHVDQVLLGLIQRGDAPVDDDG